MEKANKNVGWEERTGAMSKAIGIGVQVKGLFLRKDVKEEKI
jgi:hypothetical protein